MRAIAVMQQVLMSREMSSFSDTQGDGRYTILVSDDDPGVRRPFSFSLDPVATASVAIQVVARFWPIRVPSEPIA